ncbi:alpha/beta hydrolase [uncultured Litoreibacter sp.]|uniref:alpha/beta fold hydrolase n=1 Tax=uncultured Litoreibacter sp. TaxID=1392394 RepID=UPI00260794DD|nr:alpha/beta hydrolase [uncultured Litoreibacter sp.]
MKEPLVLLPGMMCDARLFGPQIMAFGSERAIHLPPIGQHDRIEKMAVDVLNGAPDTFALAGLSLGGIVAMEVARIAPARVTRLALMDTNPLKETPQIAANREPQIARVMAGRLPEVMRDEMKPTYLADGPQREEVLELVMAMAMDQGEGVFVRQSRALQRRLDQQSTLVKLTLPTLVLCGEDDTLCPVKRHEFMAELIQTATLSVIPNAGHLPTLENPDATTQAMRDWLAR